MRKITRIKINEKTLVQKIKILVLGKEKPNLFTRFSVIIGFFIWLYFTVWQLLIFLSIVWVDKLENAKTIKKTFAIIGGKYGFNIKYGLDTMHILFYHSLAIFVLCFFSLVGLIFIYRQKRIGHIIFVLSNVINILFTIVFLGGTYYTEQISSFDKILFYLFTLYFAVVLFVFKTKSNFIQTNS